MRIIVAECTVNYSGKLSAHLPRAVRLLIVKSDGSISIHSDGGAYKPMNWMNSPNVMVESDDAIKVTNPTDELLEITIHDKVSDQSFDFGIEPSLQKDGVEAHLQELLAADPEVIEPGFKLVKREFMTPIGPVDLLCQDEDNSYFAVEIKRRGEIDGVEQLARYLEFIDSDPQYVGVKGVFVAQSIKPQAKVLAEKRSIACLEVDYDLLRGIEKPQQALF